MPLFQPSSSPINFSTLIKKNKQKKQKTVIPTHCSDVLCVSLWSGSQHDFGAIARRCRSLVERCQRRKAHVKTLWGWRWRRSCLALCASRPAGVSGGMATVWSPGEASQWHHPGIGWRRTQTVHHHHHHHHHYHHHHHDYLAVLSSANAACLFFVFLSWRSRSWPQAVSHFKRGPLCPCVWERDRQTDR